MAGENIRALIVEDLEDDALLLVDELRRSGFEPEWVRVDSEGALFGALAGYAWDVVITDYSMPSLSGLDVIRGVKERAADLPVIIVSGVMGDDFVVDAMRAGADDYLMKGKLSRLKPAVERVLREAEARRARRRSEQEARLANRLLQTIIEINQAIVRHRSRTELLREACRVLVEQGGFTMCWVGLVRPMTGAVEPVAHAGFEDGYLDKLNILLGDAERGHGPTGTAIRIRGSVVCRDTETDERFTPWRDAARERGYRSCAAFPMRVNGEVAGALTVYSSSSMVFDDKTVNLLEKLADDLGFALQVYERDKKHAKAVEALRESEERLRTIFESTMDGMFVIDMDGRFVDVNFAGCHMFGYSREEILSSDVSLLAFQEGFDERKDEHKRYWRNGAFLPEVRLRRKDGSEVWVDLAIIPFSLGGRELALGIKRDVTERKRAEEALRESEERFRQIFEQSADAQIILRQGTCGIIDANPAAVALYGYTREELVGGGMEMLMSPQVHARCEKFFLELERGREVDIERIENIRKDGTKITVSIKGQIVSLKRNDVVYCTVHDMTEKLMLEEEARFIQAKLIHANKMASIGTLASGVAHEINNPNNFILFNSTLLSDAWKDAMKILDWYYRDSGDFSLGGLSFSEMRDVIPELLSGITDGSRRIKGIVDNLKDFSRVSKAGVRGEMDVNRAVMAAASILSTQINNYTDDFTVTCAEDLPPLKGNEQKIEQVVINLIINALHALPSKACGVQVSTSFDPGSGCVLIRVADQGNGMPAEVIERVTEPFFTTKSECGGTGLGLSISYSIIKEHNGTIEFDSEPGKGTVVTVKLPTEARHSS